MDEDLMAALEAAAAAAEAHTAHDNLAHDLSQDLTQDLSQDFPNGLPQDPPLNIPHSPEIKAEIKHESPSSEAQQTSPLKRPRTPHIEDDHDHGGEKRQRTDGDAGILENQHETDSGIADMNEIVKMIEMAQQSAAKPEAHEDHPMPDIQDGNHHTSHDILDHGIDINSIMASINNSLESGHEGTHDSEMHHDLLDHALSGADLSLSSQMTPKKTIWTNPVRYTRQTHLLPTLGRVAVDILKTLSENSLEDTIGTLGEPESQVAKEYVSLRGFFDVVKKQFSADFLLLSADQLDITSPEDRDILRIANLATTCVSMFGANELTFPDLERIFVSTFIPYGQQMSAQVAELYLGLKTQMFLTLLEEEQTKPRDQVLEELFVTNQKSALENHHPDLPLSQAEIDFLANAEERKTMLFNESGDAASIQTLSQQFIYESWLDLVSSWLNDNMTDIEKVGSGPTSSSAAADSLPLFDGTHDSFDGGFDIDAAIAAAAEAANNAVGSGGDSSNIHDDLAALLSRATEQSHTQTENTGIPSTVMTSNENAIQTRDLALQMVARNQYHPTTVPQANPVQPNGQQQSNGQQQQPSQMQPQQQYYTYNQQPNSSLQQMGVQGETVELPPGQAAASDVLYERARQAAAARSSTHARREGSHSTRRPWSPEEEKALMCGLDLVKGPHWSQILQLFGQNGRLSTILAERTQVQLKDKARNLKLFFLKTNSEMPYYLQCVTGELKTRAPTQAARKEAEERARINSEGDKAHINGIMALGNMQNGHGQRPNPTPNGAIPKSTTPGQVASHPQSHPGTPQKTAAAHPNAQTPGIPAAQPVHLQHNVSRPQPPTTSQPQGQQSRYQQQPQHAHPPVQSQQQHPQQQQAFRQQQLSQHAQPAQSQAQPQPQPPVQAQPQTQAQTFSHVQHQQAHDSPAQPKPEDCGVKHEPLNDEEAGILELKRLIDQEANASAAAA
ncbi:hypothetical protein JX265_012227 [Neoarthrinium moseri]|uniref:HTH myb-type domain-containing protein n=1 Tax=Neoarthrinium moseri TaxID=1658444 RepID=A0A9Q0AIX7_9PEZI|nr:hypothetical protein JX265_012227 [Neoarthrinium moseri]